MTGYEGRCACGAVTRAANGPTTRNLICHYESSPGTWRGFCPACGTRLYFRSETFADETHVHAATLHDQGRYAPDAQVWVSDARDWVTTTDDLEKHAGFQRDPQQAERKTRQC